MITKIAAYRSGDGTAHATLEEAQRYELCPIVMEALNAAEVKTDVPILQITKRITESLMGNTDKIIDILTMKPNSLPKARKINGGTKTRTKKHIAEQFPLPINPGEKTAA